MAKRLSRIDMINVTLRHSAAQVYKTLRENNVQTFEAHKVLETDSGLTQEELDMITSTYEGGNSNWFSNN